MRKQKNIYEKGKRRIRRVAIMVCILLISFLIPWIAAKYGWLQIDPDAAVNVFGVCASALGTILVVIELNDSEKVNCCSMLSDMNMKFTENEQLMRLYQELSRCVQDPSRKLHVDDSDENAVHSGDLMAYMTFYEVINEYIKNGVMNIQQMDDLFGDRFFKLIHNEYVQAHELYAEPSSYVNIFQLYDAWKSYRERNSIKYKRRFVVLTENAIPELYLKKQLYLQETVQFYMDKDNIPFANHAGDEKHLSLRRLFPQQLAQVMALQDKIVDGISDKEIFAPSSVDEILESMLVDYCYGLYDNDKLVAFCICVLDRSTKHTADHERNLCVLTDRPKAFDEYITFDTIQVDPDYRGYGIQRFFLAESEKVAVTVGAKNIIATVAPTNQYSRAMFEEAGYDKFGGKEIPLYNSVRYLMVKNLRKE